MSVGSVPLCFCVLARAVNEAKARWRIFVLRFLTWIAILHYLFSGITQLFFQYDYNANRLCTNIHGADDPTSGVCYQCIHRGPNGHLVCPFPICPVTCAPDQPIDAHSFCFHPTPTRSTPICSTGSRNSALISSTSSSNLPQQQAINLQGS